jgi:hypothetical protein
MKMLAIVLERDVVIFQKDACEDAGWNAITVHTPNLTETELQPATDGMLSIGLHELHTRHANALESRKPL